MKRMITVISAILISASTTLLAHGAGGCNCHGNHGHAAPHGGLIEETSREHHVELLGDDEQLSVWVLDDHMHELKNDTLTVSAQVVLPRGKTKTIPLNLQKKGSAFVADLDLPSRVHRFGVQVTLSEDNWSETVEFQLEP